MPVRQRPDARYVRPAAAFLNRLDMVANEDIEFGESLHLRFGTSCCRLGGGAQSLTGSGVRCGCLLMSVRRSRVGLLQVSRCDGSFRGWGNPFDGIAEVRTRTGKRSPTPASVTLPGRRSEPLEDHGAYCSMISVTAPSLTTSQCPKSPGPGAQTEKSSVENVVSPPGSTYTVAPFATGTVRIA